MKNFNDTEIGKRIRLLREKTGYSREHLSEMAGIGSKFLYEIETGKKSMSAYTLFNHAALNVSCDYILSGKTQNEDFSYIVNILSTMQKDDISRIEKIIKHIAEIANSKQNHN